MRTAPDDQVLSSAGLPPDGAARLATARRVIEDGAVSVLSLDVFDTLLWREVPRPTDAFVVLGARLAAEGMLEPDLTPEAFRRLRMSAEQEGREAREREGRGSEVTLHEIWERIPARIRRDAPASRCAELEVDVEAQLTRVDLDVVALAELAAAAGCRLVLVSNTYLSAQHLARLLGRPQTEVLRNATAYPSSAFGVHKGNGLWKVVLDDLGVAPQRVLHVGDDSVADDEAPAELGIRTAPYPQLVPETAAVLARESSAPAAHLPPGRHAVDPRRGDLGLTALRAKVGARVERVALPRDQALAWHYGAVVLGPVLAGFSEMVVGWASELRVPTAWCPMREGELLADLTNRAAWSRRAAVAARPVWLSRHVTARAVISEASRPELEALLSRRLTPTVAEYLANLGLGVGEVPELRAAAHERLDRPDLNGELIELLSTEEHLRSRIVAESAALRRRLVRHLQPMLDEPGDTTLLVDLGWQGTIQHQLARALQLAGVERRLVGVYLLTNEGAVRRRLDGLEVHGYLGDCGEPYGDLEAIVRSPEIIEQACLATCGSLVDFGLDDQPVLDGSVPPPEQVNSKLAVQHGIRAFQQEWIRYREAEPDRPGFDGTERPYLREVLRSSVTHPTPEEARTLGAWGHDDNFGVNLRERVVPERLGAFVPYLSAVDLADMTMQEAYWPVGLAAEHDAGLAAAVQALLAGQLDRDAFEMSRAPASVEMSVDSSHGFGTAQRRPLRINRNGRSYAHFDLRADRIRSFRLDPCDGPAVFRIDWIDLLLRIRGRRDMLRHRIEGDEALRPLVWAGCRRLYDGVAIATGDDPQLHVDLRRYCGEGEIYGVDLTVAMGVLPLPRPPGDVAAPPPPPAGLLGLAGKVRRDAAAGGAGALGRGALRVARRALR